MTKIEAYISSDPQKKQKQKQQQQQQQQESKMKFQKITDTTHVSVDRSLTSKMLKLVNQPFEWKKERSK